MSGNDKTGDRLVASIRKTKAGAQTAQGEVPAAAGKRRRAAATVPTAKARADAVTRAGTYQHGRRVWPD
ncbi:MAG: hypothetical protein LJE59_06475 [Chromatiaceae bacterium]|nr:hypothetical protein [Chromatiaceae bacterium]